MRGLAVGGMEVRWWTGVGAGSVGKVEVLGELARLLRHRHLTDQFIDPLRDLLIGRRRRCRGCLLSHGAPQLRDGSGRGWAHSFSDVEPSVSHVMNGSVGGVLLPAASALASVEPGAYPGEQYYGLDDVPQTGPGQ